MTAMIRIACHAHHGTSGERLCPECSELLAYADLRLSKCPFRGSKPTCAKCTIHCYTPTRREQVREVMRYAGPRMLLYHPLLALMHLADGLRQPARRRSE